MRRNVRVFSRLVVACIIVEETIINTGMGIIGHGDWGAGDFVEGREQNNSEATVSQPHGWHLCSGHGRRVGGRRNSSNDVRMEARFGTSIVANGTPVGWWWTKAARGRVGQAILSKRILQPKGQKNPGVK